MTSITSACEADNFLFQAARVQTVYSLLCYALLLCTGVLIGYLGHYLHIHSHRSHFEADERRKNYKKCYQTPDDIEHIREWLPNSRGALLFCQQLIPKHKKMVGLIGICHGFMDHTSNFHIELAIRLCRSGYAVVMVDAEGHGLSDGIYGYVRSIDDIVGDCSDFFLRAKNSGRYEGLPFFVYGESMGGATAFNLCTKSPCGEAVEGVVLVAPMLKISDDMRMVPQFIVDFISRVVVPCLPFAPLAPVRDVIPFCYKTEKTLRQALEDSLHYDMKPRLGSAIAMLNATADISSRLSSLRHPVMIIHGGADTVTCPETSKHLFNTCESKDKLLKIYPGCLHGLMKAGDEPLFPDIFNDLITWLSEHTSVGVKKGSSSAHKK